MKRFLALTLAGTLLLSNTTIFAATFADISKVPWPGAATFINQAADLGLMSGYTENGRKYCKPRNKVTYNEATQLIYSIMKTYYKDDANESIVSKWKPIMVAYNIPIWAYPAVSYSLEKGILITTDLSRFMKGNTQQYATREDVGILFGKALGKIYGVDMNAKLTYKDAGSIAKTSVPYLDLLYDKKIMVGDDYNKFNPKTNINRAEMAVLSVKSYNLLTTATPVPPPMPDNNKPDMPSSGNISGIVSIATVLENGDLFCSIRTTDGKGLNLFGKKGTSKVYYDGDEISFSDISVDDTVTVSYANGDIQTLTITKSTQGVSNKLTYDLVDITSSKVVVKDGSREKTYTLDNAVQVYINDTSSSPSKLYSALSDKKNFSVTLHINKDNKVTKIYATETTKGSKTGLLKDLDDKEITIKASDGKSYDYKLSSSVSVSDSLTDMSFSDLKKRYDDTNYYVTLTTDSKGVVTKITIDYAEDDANGILTDITSRKVTIKSNGKEYTYSYYASDVDVKVDGKSKDMDYLKEHYEDTSYRVALTINRDDEITKIVATEEKMGASKGIITYMSSSKIDIKDNKGTTYSYSVLDDTDDIDVTLNGRSSDYERLREAYKKYDYEATLSFKNRKVSKISATNQEADKGELRALDYDEISIYIDGSKFTYDLDEDVIVELEDDDYTLKKLIEDFNKRYDNFEVKLSFDSKHSKVTRISAEYLSENNDTAKGDLVEVSRSKVRIKTSSRTKTYYFSNRFDEVSDVRGDVDDLDDLIDRFDDGDGRDYYIKLELNRDEEVTKLTAERT